MYLSERTATRDNNFDILRFLAALQVLVLHSFACFGIHQPRWFSFIPEGVPVFFIISGFLITRSWFEKPDFFLFLKKRILRIYPALIVVVLFTALVLGPIVTTLPLKDYFFHPGFFDYFKNFFLYEIYHLLPGVFETTPYTQSVNASLWTLPLEFFMYVLIAVFGLKKLLNKKYFYHIFIITTIFLFIFFSNTHIVAYRWVKLMRLLTFFFISSYLYVYREQIKLTPPQFLLLVIIYFASVNTFLFEYIRFFTLPYIVIWLAYCKISYVDNFGKYGDFSYGLYLWAFPVQQTLAYFWLDKFNIYTYNLSVFVITLCIAILSFKFIEKPALKLKNVNIYQKMIK